MAKAEKNRFFNFYIINIKIRKKNSTKEVDENEYVKLLNKVYAKKIHEESSPNKHCIFKFMFSEKNGDKIDYLSGSFAQFTFFHNEKWINLESLDVVEEFKVPNGLFPDAKITDFVFVPKAHRFCYWVNNEFKISPYTIKKFLERAIDKVIDSNMSVQIDVESNQSSIKAIKESREIRKLRIDINYSNFDSGPDIKKFVENQIKNSNSSRMVMEITQKPNESINIDKSDLIKGAIEASISNGETEATILDENNRVKKIKTSQFPRMETVSGTKSRFNELIFDKIISIFRANGN